jgi:hypothetical protein
MQKQRREHFVVLCRSKQRDGHCCMLVVSVQKAVTGVYQEVFEHGWLEGNPGQWYHLCWPTQCCW